MRRRLPGKEPTERARAAVNPSGAEAVAQSPVGRLRLTGCSGRCTHWRWSRCRPSAPPRCSSSESPGRCPPQTWLRRVRSAFFLTPPSALPRRALAGQCSRRGDGTSASRLARSLVLSLRSNNRQPALSLLCAGAADCQTRTPRNSDLGFGSFRASSGSLQEFEKDLESGWGECERGLSRTPSKGQDPELWLLPVRPRRFCSEVLSQRPRAGEARNTIMGSLQLYSQKLLPFYFLCILGLQFPDWIQPRKYEINTERINRQWKKMKKTRVRIRNKNINNWDIYLFLFKDVNSCSS